MNVLNALVAGNGSYIVRPCGHDLHGPTAPKPFATLLHNYTLFSKMLRSFSGKANYLVNVDVAV